MEVKALKEKEVFNSLTTEQIPYLGSNRSKFDCLIEFYRLGNFIKTKR